MSGITTATLRPRYCAGTKRYKGLRYPDCNGGMPCVACLAKYKQKQAELERKRGRR